MRALARARGPVMGSRPQRSVRPAGAREPAGEGRPRAGLLALDSEPRDRGAYLLGRLFGLLGGFGGLRACSTRALKSASISGCMIASALFALATSAKPD
jgi:hypothetical protein